MSSCYYGTYNMLVLPTLPQETVCAAVLCAITFLNKSLCHSWISYIRKGKVKKPAAHWKQKVEIYCDALWILWQHVPGCKATCFKCSTSQLEQAEGLPQGCPASQQ